MILIVEWGGPCEPEVEERNPRRLSGLATTLVLYILLENLQGHATCGRYKVTSVPQSALMFSPTLSAVTLEEELAGDGFEASNNGRHRCGWWAFD
jgi:hypothetical protein